METFETQTMQTEASVFQECSNFFFKFNFFKDFFFFFDVGHF